MNRTSIIERVLSIMLLVMAVFALPVQGQDVAPASPLATPGASEEASFRNTIIEIESHDGPYAQGLSESLLSLALTLQSQGRHGEAIELFRRGIHLTRINEGLYCPQQIPLLQGEIASDIAMQDYTQADERQRYLSRVLLRSTNSSEALTAGLMQQAKWQYHAYQLGLGSQGYVRLMEMWNFYGRAREDIIAREGEVSPNLLPPLYGMLQAQYLISSYVMEEPTQTFIGDDVRLDPLLLQFKGFRSRSYQQGNAVISAIGDIEQKHPAQSNLTLAQTLVMMGDWHLWNGKTDAAWQAYREAEAELATQNGAQSPAITLFDQPVPLPALAGMNPLPPQADPDQANILLNFSVNAQGRVKNLERVDDNEGQYKQASHLMKRLRKTKFRPRFEAGQPVETEKLVKAFNIQQ